MGLRVVNGKIQLDSKPKGIDAPSPSQIAERAYDLATRLVVEEIENGAHSGMTMGAYLASRRADTLKALRQSVVEPSAIPWWRK